jgi:hypothetical protein
MPAGFALCLPAKTLSPPSGDIWLHEIKLDEFQMIARKDGERVRLPRFKSPHMRYTVCAHVDFVCP